jgi:hypothetical protein
MCDDARDELGSLRQSVLGDAVYPKAFPSKPFASYETRATAIERRVVRDLRALAPPKSDAKRISEGLAAMSTYIDADARLARFALGDGTEYQQAVRTPPPAPLIAALKRFAAYGVASCAYLGPPEG